MLNINLDYNLYKKFKMIVKKILIILIINFSCLTIQSQGVIAAIKQSEIKLTCDIFLGFDNQKSIYSLNNNILTKNSDGITYQYNNLSLGKITNVDFQNPLQIVIFYKNFNTVVLLDNQLNEIKKIDFNLKVQGIFIKVACFLHSIV